MQEIKLNNTEQKIFDLIRGVISADSSLSLVEPRICGGWVRDKILGRESDDLDITVNHITGYAFAKKISQYAKKNHIDGVSDPYQVSLDKVADPKEKKAIDPLQVGGMDIFGLKVEFIGLRKEIYTDDSRTPQIVATDNVLEDVKRRDLTINALYYNVLTGEVEDYVGGLKDLEVMHLRTPDEPEKTYAEDPLRLLRAIRFYAKFPGSTLDTGILKSLASMDDDNSSLSILYRQKVATSRAAKELIKIMESDNPERAIYILFRSGFYKRVFEVPDNWFPFDMDQLSPYHNLTLIDHTLSVLKEAIKIAEDHWIIGDSRAEFLFAAIFHDFGKMSPDIRKEHPKHPGKMQYINHEDVSAEFINNLLIKMSFPEQMRKNIVAIVKGHMRPSSFDGKNGSALRRQFGKFLRDFPEVESNIMYLRLADLLSKGKQSQEDIDKIVSNNKRLYKELYEYVYYSYVSGFGFLFEKPLLDGDVIKSMVPEVSQEIEDRLRAVKYKFMINNSFTNHKDLHWIKYLQEQLIEQQQTHRIKTVEDAKVFVRGQIKQVFNNGQENDRLVSEDQGS